MKEKQDELLSQVDIDTMKIKDKISDMCSWFFSNLFSLLFPVGAVFLIEAFEKNGNFDIRNSYSEMLMVTISICMNILIQLNSKDYRTRESSNTIVRVISVGILVVSSLAYGIARTIPEKEINMMPVFAISVILLTAAFIIGLGCEFKKKERE